MIAFLRSYGNVFRLVRFCLAAVALVCCLSGCAGWGVKDEGFADNDLSETVRQARPPKKDANYLGLSDKGRQIEQDLHSM